MFKRWSLLVYHQAMIGQLAVRNETLAAGESTGIIHVVADEQASRRLDRFDAANRSVTAQTPVTPCLGTGKAKIVPARYDPAVHQNRKVAALANMYFEVGARHWASNQGSHIWPVKREQQLGRRVHLLSIGHWGLLRPRLHLDHDR